MQTLKNIVNENESKNVGMGTPEFTPVEIGPIPETANPVAEMGNPLQ
jgi:hypothetical protein